MRSLLLKTALVMALHALPAAAGEISGVVHLTADSYVLLRTGSGDQVVRTGPWTAYGNMPGPGSLKYGGDRVRVSFEQEGGVVPLATAIIREAEYTPAADQVIDHDQLILELGGGISLLVDVRGRVEHEAGFIPGSVGLKSVAELVKSLKAGGTAKRVVLYGSSAGDLRPYEVAREAKAGGLTDVRIFTGGLHGWRNAGKAVYVSPGHLATLTAGGAAFRLIDLRAAADNTIPLIAGAESIPAATVTRDAIFLRHRSYQLPIFLYGEEADSLAVAAKLTEWNFIQDGEFAILDPSWKEWVGKYGKSAYQPGQLPSKEIGMEEFRSLWLKSDPAKVFLNVKPKRDRNSLAEIHIPIEELLQRMGELPRDRELVIYCSYGLRSAVAWQILRDSGYRARFLNRTINIDSSGNISSDN